MTPSGILKLKPNDRKNSFVIYIDIDYKTRLNRLEKRKDSDNAKRRISTDESDFFNYIDYDMNIKNPKFGDSELIEILQKSNFLIN